MREKNEENERERIDHYQPRRVTVNREVKSDERIRFLDHRPLPEVKRIPGLKLSGQAFADIVMVFEFLHNFGETLGFGESRLLFSYKFG